MKNKDRTSAMVGVGIGILISISSYGLGLGNWHEPGPGFMPFFSGLMISLLGVVVFMEALFRREPEPALPEGKKELLLFRNWKVIVTLGMLFAYALFIDLIGFALDTFLFLGVLLWVVERFKGWKALSLAAVFTGAIYLLFEVLLKVQMPSGLLPW
jgi:putative tricarboxylic transport membrane protein